MLVYRNLGFVTQNENNFFKRKKLGIENISVCI